MDKLSPHPLGEIFELGDDLVSRPVDTIAWTLPQAEFLSCDYPFALWLDGNQLGKAQPVDAPVLTPNGWRAIGDLVAGDEVIAGDGTVTRVVGVYPQGERDVVRFTFDDDAEAECCDEHLWVVKDAEARFRKESPRYSKWGVRTAGEIRERWGEEPAAKQRVAIPTVGRGDRAERPVLIDPYLMGVLLGDGGLTVGVVFSTADPEIVEAVRAVVPAGVTVRPRGNAYDWQISGDGRGPGSNPLINSLRVYGLFGKKSEHKHIPTEYLHNSPSVRLAVLQGLMDTDGDIGIPHGCPTFGSTSRALAEGVRDLVRSLGGKASIADRQTRFANKHGARVKGLPSFRVRIRLPGVDLFRLERKRCRRKDPTSTTDDRVLWSIRPSRRAECVCIAVEHPDQTYVTSDYVVTHNTYSLAADFIYRLRGRHPFQWVPPAPISALMLGVSHEQMGRADGPMEKLYQLLPRDEVDWDLTTFRRGKGFTGKPPVLAFKNGSTLNFGTFNQPVEVSAGPTLQHIGGDEPIPRYLLDELLPRLLRKRGTLRLTFTPTPGMPEQKHLRDRCAEHVADPTRGIKLYNFGLRAENTRPQSAPWPLVTQADIDRLVSLWPAEVVPMRRDGSWDPLITDRHVSAWDPTVHCSPTTWKDPPPGGDSYVVVSLDHGLAVGKQVAGVSVFSGRTGKHPRMWVWNMRVGDGRTTSQQDAELVAGMLAECGLGYQHVDAWVADRAVRDDDRVVRKDNEKLRAFLAEHYGVSFRSFPEIDPVFKRQGSVYSGITLLNALAADRTDAGEPCLLVHPARCAALGKAFDTYKGGPRDPAKDRVDMARYAAEKAIELHPGLQLIWRGRH